MCDGAGLFFHKCKDGAAQWGYYYSIHRRCREMEIIHCFMLLLLSFFNGAHFSCKAERPKRNITEHLLYYYIHMLV